MGNSCLGATRGIYPDGRPRDPDRIPSPSPMRNSEAISCACAMARPTRSDHAWPGQSRRRARATVAEAMEYQDEAEGCYPTGTRAG